MKKIVFLTFLAVVAFQLEGQTGKVDQLQAVEQNQPDHQDITATATLKVASRLFATKDDLTSVILIIPADSVVDVLDSDSTYLHVVFEENEGYIFRRQAILDKIPVNVQEQQQGRFSYLENKYGSNIANRIFSGKIWKGMNSEMVKDSWGNADKINRIISGNITKEEWIFRSTWLYFENNTLLEWGPVKKQ